MAEPIDAERGRRNRLSAIVLALVAIGFFVAFVIATILRGAAGG